MVLCLLQPVDDESLGIALLPARVKAFASVEELNPFLRDSAAIDVPLLRNPAMISAGCQSMSLLSIYPLVYGHSSLICTINLQKTLYSQRIVVLICSSKEFEYSEFIKSYCFACSGIERFGGFY